jgi:hypothetical protein
MFDLISSGLEILAKRSVSLLALVSPAGDGSMLESFARQAARETSLRLALIGGEIWHSAILDIDVVFAFQFLGNDCR